MISKKFSPKKLMIKLVQIVECYCNEMERKHKKKKQSINILPSSIVLHRAKCEDKKN